MHFNNTLVFIGQIKKKIHKYQRYIHYDIKKEYFIAYSLYKLKPCHTEMYNHRFIVKNRMT